MFSFIRQKTRPLRKKLHVGKKIKWGIKQCLPYGLVSIYQKKREARMEALRIPPSGARPAIYNSQGQPMDMFFLKDNHLAHGPYDSNPYFLWDRYNWGLNVHFYTGRHILHPYPNAERVYAWLPESEGIVPDEYKALLKAKSLWREFERIFTFSAKVLDIIPNASFVPASCLWYGVFPFAGGELTPSAWERKTKNISLVSSNKIGAPLHHLRRSLAADCKNDPSLGIDAYGTFAGGPFIPAAQALTDYRFSIVLENYISSYFFTEKILNCFAAMTVPIYLGAPNIADFFNSEGIIILSERACGNLREITKQCTEQEYMRRLDAIKDNYTRALNYRGQGEYIYANYLRDDPFFIARHASALKIS